MNDRGPRIFKQHFFVFTFGLILVAAAGGAMIIEGSSPEITVLELPGAPNDIVFIADPHVKEGNVAYLEGVIEQINGLNASMVLIGGDFVTSDEGELDFSTQYIWGELDAPVYAVLGNHDYVAGVHGLNGPAKMLAMQEANLTVDGYDVSMLADDPLIDFAFGDAVAAELASNGVDVLRNEYRLIDVNGTPLLLVGVDDAWAGLADPPEVPATDAYTIYMIHEPGARADWDADLILAGHLHGGQFSSPGINLLDNSGIIDISGFSAKPGTLTYITRGIGTSSLIGVDIRSSAPPEIVVINPSVPIGGATVLTA